MKLLFFTASWCSPCRKLKPIMREIAEQYNLDVDELDVTLHRKTATVFNVASTPTVVVIDNDGNEINRVTGAKPKADMVSALFDELNVSKDDLPNDAARRGVVTRASLD